MNHTNPFHHELQSLKPYDEVQHSERNERTKGYEFISTAGHGYLVVPKSDPRAVDAAKICEYGFNGILAFYLEEDVEASQFLSLIPSYEPPQTQDRE